MVRQLHIHVIGRKTDDVVFPKPVWGNNVEVPYNKAAAEFVINRIKSHLND